MSRYFWDRVAKHLVLVLGIVAFLILVAIAVFIIQGGIPALQEVGLFKFLFGTQWYPLHDKYGIATMIVGSVLVTALALVIAVPLSLGCALFLAEVAPPRIRGITRSAVELLIGIPSVVYGLVAIVVLLPIIADISGRGSGASLLAAGIVLAVMILPTVTAISADSISAVPAQYKEGALALGATHWQTIRHVLLPSARRGIIAAVILGTGRAIGETMAMLMVIGNSPIFPDSIFSPVRTLTGNIALEIMAATGTHRSALFATGIVLFVLIMVINSIAIIAYRKARR